MAGTVDSQQPTRQQNTATTTTEQQQQPSPNQWKYGLFACFADPTLCATTYFCPCYTVGRNAQGLGDDCMIHGLLCMLGLNFNSVIRYRLRTRERIEGSMLLDVLTASVCCCCTAIQDARQLGWNKPASIGDVGREQDMSRE